MRNRVCGHVWIEEDVGAHCQRCGDLIVPTAKCLHDCFECTHCHVQVAFCHHCRQQRTCDQCWHGILVSLGERRSIVWRIAGVFARIVTIGMQGERHYPVGIIRVEL
jgi:hypothetical protein